MQKLTTFKMQIIRMKNLLLCVFIIPMPRKGNHLQWLPTSSFIVVFTIIFGCGTTRHF